LYGESVVETHNVVKFSVFLSKAVIAFIYKDREVFPPFYSWKTCLNISCMSFIFSWSWPDEDIAG